VTRRIDVERANATRPKIGLRKCEAGPSASGRVEPADAIHQPEPDHASTGGIAALDRQRKHIIALQSRCGGRIGLPGFAVEHGHAGIRAGPYAARTIHSQRVHLLPIQTQIGRPVDAPDRTIIAAQSAPSASPQIPFRVLGQGQHPVMRQFAILRLEDLPTTGRAAHSCGGPHSEPALGAQGHTTTSQRALCSTAIADGNDGMDSIAGQRRRFRGEMRPGHARVDRADRIERHRQDHHSHQ